MEIVRKDDRAISVVEKTKDVIDFSVVYDFKNVYDAATEMARLYDFYINMYQNDEYTYAVIGRMRTILFEFLETLSMSEDVFIRGHEIRRPNEWTDLAIISKLSIKKGDALNLLKIQNTGTYNKLITEPVFDLEILLDDIQ